MAVRARARVCVCVCLCAFLSSPLWPCVCVCVCVCHSMAHRGGDGGMVPGRDEYTLGRDMSACPARPKGMARVAARCSADTRNACHGAHTHTHTHTQMKDTHTHKCAHTHVNTTPHSLAGLQYRARCKRSCVVIHIRTLSRALAAVPRLYRPCLAFWAVGLSNNLASLSAMPVSPCPTWPPALATADASCKAGLCVCQWL